MNGWQKINGKWYYFENNTYATGWKAINGSWYYFNSDGVMQTGWLKVNNKWYYLDSSGAMLTGWQQLKWSGGEDWFYFDDTGAMQSGWYQSNGKWYYLDSGAMYVGWLHSNGKWYYLATSGEMLTGWQKIKYKNNDEWFYLDPSTGAMRTGWNEINGKWYYLDENTGVMYNSGLSGSLKTSTYGSMGLVLLWTATQDIAKNQSTVKWTLKSYGKESSFYYMAGNFNVVLNGKAAYSNSDRIKLYGNGATTVATGSTVIAHNNDGTNSFTASVSAGIYTVAPNVSGSATFTLQKIPRTPSAPTSVSITANQGSYVGLGDTVTIKWSGSSGVITGYDIQYSRGNSGWKDYKSVSTSATSGSTTDSFTSTDINVNGAGKAVKYRVRAKNGTLTSAWKESNTLTISGAMDLKVSGAWKTGSVWIKVNGTWKRAKRVWIKVNGTWKQTK